MPAQLAEVGGTNFLRPLKLPGRRGAGCGSIKEELPFGGDKPRRALFVDDPAPVSVRFLRVGGDCSVDVAFIPKWRLVATPIAVAAVEVLFEFSCKGMGSSVEAPSKLEYSKL